jgi:hypothetical protein
MRIGNVESPERTRRNVTSKHHAALWTSCFALSFAALFHYHLFSMVPFLFQAHTTGRSTSVETSVTVSTFHCNSVSRRSATHLQ